MKIKPVDAELNSLLHRMSLIETISFETKKAKESIGTSVQCINILVGLFI